MRVALRRASMALCLVLLVGIVPAIAQVSTGEILGKVTPMPVHEVSEGMAVEPNHVYLVPPATNMALTDGSSANLHIARRKDIFAANHQHEKALIADTWAIQGSMNLTHSGVELNGELVTLTSAPEEVANLAAEIMGLFREPA